MLWISALLRRVLDIRVARPSLPLSGWRWLICVLGLWSTSWFVLSETRPIAVLVPDPSSAYRVVFDQMKAGISAQVPGNLVWLPVRDHSDPERLSSALKRQDIRLVIALGRTSLAATAQLDRTIRVLGGGVMGLPEGYPRAATVLSLVPEPLLLFTKLKAINPSVRRVVVIYNPLKSGWYVLPAVEAAAALGISLVALEAVDLKAALRHYHEFFAFANSKQDALWLPLDSVTVNDEIVLPLVLMESWSRRIPVISNSAYHAKLGVLLALYPDNYDVGRTLGGLALSPDLPAGKSMLPLRTGAVAFNRRTASHLGLSTAALHAEGAMEFPDQ